MILPPLADAMYRTWWSFANYVANAVDEAGNYLYSVAQAQEAASIANRDVYGGQGGYNPIGLSQLFSAARRIGNSSASLTTADDSSPITPSMIAEAPWSRSPAEQAAVPKWQVRVTMTYTDASGVTQDGTAVVEIPQVLPRNVGSLRSQIEERIADQLAAPPGTGTPRTGSLDSVNSITLLAVLDAGRWHGALHQAGRADLHAGVCHVP